MRTPLLTAIACLGSTTSVHAQWSTLTMPIGRTDFAAAVSSRALYVSGGNHLWTMLDSVDVMHLPTGAWTQVQMSTPRKHHAVVALGDEVFFAGGWPWFDSSHGALDSVDIYDEAAGTWSLEQLPQAAALLSAGTLGDKIYFAGGGNPIFQSIIQVFDTMSRSWAVLQVPGPGRGRQIARSNERWLCFGGDGGFSRRIDVLDGSTGIWAHLVAPDIMETMALDGNRLLMTSCSTGLAEHVLHEYDLVSGQWRVRRRPTDRCFSHSATIGPFTVFANGFGPLNAIYPDAEVFNRLTGEWTNFPLSIAARGRVEVVHKDSGRVFVIGGTRTFDQQSVIPNIDVFQSFPSLGVEFCAASPNSTGAVTQLVAAGMGSSQDDWFFLGIEGGPAGAAAMFVASANAMPAAPLPGSQGALCLANPLARLAATVGTIDAAGRYASQVALLLPTLPPRAIGAGETWHFQCWYRDANPVLTSNFSTARSVTFD